ncbi:hypothetical protein [Streptomyces sp. Ag109_G2-15]|uniref:hypothetical protein n=1 Tax=Streptomyces sp. Ag109_G2-15 TaxID=1938850 RepID=UPI000BD0ABF1|nr:hypothetical protein [Streptomyces sp. Ag109_G2-15]SOD85866.1 hypothetical protein SAMN06272765_3301 [Streptomyces sp. Ag109_G2-15]
MSKPGSVINDRKFKRIRTFAILTGVGLSVSVIELGALGAADASTAMTFGGRITGVAFLLSALLALAAAFAMFTYSSSTQGPSYSAAAILIGVTIAGLMNLGLLILQIEGGDYTPYLWLWASLTFWSSWTLVVLRRRGVWKRIPQPKKIAAGMALTGVLAAANFTYTQIYKPYAQPSKIELTTSFGKPSITPDGKSVALPLHVSLENAGDVSVYVAATLYQVTARKAHTSKGRTMQDWQRDIDEDQLDLRRDVDVDGYDLIQSGPIVDAGVYIEPGDKEVEIKVIEMPLSGLYDVLFAKGEAVILRKDKISLSSDFGYSGTRSWDENDQHAVDAPEWVDPAPKNEFIEYQAPIEENSAILKMIRGSKNLTVWWVLDQPKNESEFGPYLMGTIASINDEDREPSAPENDQTSQRYGLAFLTSGIVQESFGAVTKSVTG